MKKSFLGTGWAFPPEFSLSEKGAIMSSDEENINQSIRAILGTIPGERVMNVNFGCNLREYLFDSMNITAQTRIKNIVSRALNENEPRIKVEDVILDNEDILEGLLRILVEYTVITTNQRNNMVYDFYKVEGTEIK